MAEIAEGDMFLQQHAPRMWNSFEQFMLRVSELGVWGQTVNGVAQQLEKPVRGLTLSEQFSLGLECLGKAAY